MLLIPLYRDLHTKHNLTSVTNICLLTQKIIFSLTQPTDWVNWTHTELHHNSHIFGTTGSHPVIWVWRWVALPSSAENNAMKAAKLNQHGEVADQKPKQWAERQ